MNERATYPGRGSVKLCVVCDSERCITGCSRLWLWSRTSGRCTVIFRVNDALRGDFLARDTNVCFGRMCCNDSGGADIFNFDHPEAESESVAFTSPSTSTVASNAPRVFCVTNNE